MEQTEEKRHAPGTLIYEALRSTRVEGCSVPTLTKQAMQLHAVSPKFFISPY